MPMLKKMKIINWFADVCSDARIEAAAPLLFRIPTVIRVGHSLIGYDHGLLGCYIEGYTPTAASAGNRTRRCQLSVLASFATNWAIQPDAGACPDGERHSSLCLAGPTPPGTPLAHPLLFLRPSSSGEGGCGRGGRGYYRVSKNAVETRCNRFPACCGNLLKTRTVNRKVSMSAKLVQ